MSKETIQQAADLICEMKSGQIKDFPLRLSPDERKHLREVLRKRNVRQIGIDLNPKGGMIFYRPEVTHRRSFGRR